MIIGSRLSSFDPSELNGFIIELVDFTIVLAALLSDEIFHVASKTSQFFSVDIILIWASD